MPETVHTLVVVEAGVISTVETYADEELAREAWTAALQEVDVAEDDVGLFETAVRQ